MLLLMLLVAVGLGRFALKSSSDDELVRGATAGGAVTLLSPPAEVRAGMPLFFAWRPVADARRYRLEVLNAAGEVALEAETTDTLIASEMARQLAPGDYHWWVTALVSPAADEPAESSDGFDRLVPSVSTVDTAAPACLSAAVLEPSSSRSPLSFPRRN